MSHQPEFEITVTRSGGIAGLTQRLLATTTSRLPPAEAQTVRELIERADFFRLRSPVLAPGADRYEYTIAISRDGHAREVKVTDGAGTTALQDLIAYLVDLSRKEV